MRDYLCALALPGVNTVYIADHFDFIPVSQIPENIKDMLLYIGDRIRRIVYHNKSVFLLSADKIVY